MLLFKVTYKHQIECLSLFFPSLLLTDTLSLSHSHSHTNSFSLSALLKPCVLMRPHNEHEKLLSSFFLLNHPLLCSLSLWYIYTNTHTHSHTHTLTHTPTHTHTHTSCFKDASSVFDWLYYLMKLFTLFPTGYVFEHRVKVQWKRIKVVTVRINRYLLYM
jgi:hypothetical protein